MDERNVWILSSTYYFQGIAAFGRNRNTSFLTIGIFLCRIHTKRIHYIWMTSMVQNQIFNMLITCFSQKGDLSSTQGSKTNLYMMSCSPMGLEGDNTFKMCYCLP